MTVSDRDFVAPSVEVLRISDAFDHPFFIEISSSWASPSFQHHVTIISVCHDKFNSVTTISSCQHFASCHHHFIISFIMISVSSIFIIIFQHICGFIIVLSCHHMTVIMRSKDAFHRCLLDLPDVVFDLQAIPTSKMDVMQTFGRGR